MSIEKVEGMVIGNGSTPPSRVNSPPSFETFQKMAAILVGPKPGSPAILSGPDHLGKKVDTRA